MFGWRGSRDFSAHRHFYGANPLGQHCDNVALGGSANSNAIEPPRAEDKNAKTHAFFNIEVGGTP